MSLVSSIRFIISHPLNRDSKLKAIARFLNWQIISRLVPYPIIYNYTEKAKLIIQKGMTGATGNLYCGLHEYSDMSFLLHFLRTDDLFVDVGANIGSYTVLASSQIGASTISIEPVPTTFSHLVDNVYLNKVQLTVRLLNMAIGSKKGQLGFTSRFDTINHVVDNGELADIKVPVDTLDNILANDCPLLMKIDVEGFETEVIKGANATLNRKTLKALIIELNGSGARYGYREEDIHRKLLDFGFEPFIYDPVKRTLQLVNSFGKHNTIYVRDKHFVEGRLVSAQSLKILNKIF